MIEPTHHPGLKPRDLVLSDLELASPPAVYARITALLDDPSATTRDMARVLEADPSLTARLLKIVNSAFYGFPSQIATVSRAITVIGGRELQNLVLATTVVDLFDGLPRDLADASSLWQRSLRGAVLAKVLARRQTTDEAAEAVFVGALLREVGHLVIYRRLPELARETLLRAGPDPVELAKVEQAVLGFDYAAVGGELARLWKLPEVLVELVACHLRPETARQYVTETALVYLSTVVASEGLDPSEVSGRLPAEAAPWRRAGCSQQQLLDVLPEADERYQAALALFR